MPKKTKTIDSKREQVAGLLARLPNEKDHPHAAIITELRQELRLIQGFLTPGVADHTLQANWCEKKSSNYRLKQMGSLIQGLRNETVEQKKGSKWDSFLLKKQAELTPKQLLEQSIEKFTQGTSFDNKERKALGLDELGPSERIKSLHRAKDMALQLGYVGGEIVPPVGKMVKETAQAVHGGLGSTVVNFSATLSGVALAIPIVGAGITATMLLVEVSKGAMEARGYSDRAQRLVLGAIAVASVILTVVFPLYFTAIAAVMVGAGIYATYMKPYMDLGVVLNQLNTEIKTLEERKQQLEENFSSQELLPNDKKILNQKLLALYSENEDISLESFEETKERINKGNTVELMVDPTIKQALGKEDLQRFLLSDGEKQLNQLNQKKESVTAARKMKRDQSICGIFTMVGAALVAVPFPPIMFLGISIMVVSSIAGVIITYKEPIANAWTNFKHKVANFFNPASEYLDNSEPSSAPKNSIELEEIEAPESPDPEQAVTPEPTVTVEQVNWKTYEPEEKNIRPNMHKELAEEAMAKFREMKKGMPTQNTEEKQAKEDVSNTNAPQA